MKIMLTKGEYRDMLIAVEIARHVLGNIETTEDRIEELKKTLLTHAYDFECDDMVEKTDTGTVLRDRVHHDVDKRLEEYDNSAFWDELSSRLGERDAYERLSQEDRDRMSNDDDFRGEKIADFAERYDLEFDTHGVGRLRISP
jgi:hypothetical protein